MYIIHNTDLASEGMEAVGVRVAVASVEQGWVSLGHGGSNESASNDLEVGAV